MGVDGALHIGIGGTGNREHGYQLDVAEGGKQDDHHGCDVRQGGHAMGQAGHDAELGEHADGSQVGKAEPHELPYGEHPLQRGAAYRVLPLPMVSRISVE
ncbi:hypothetical protein Salpa_5765 [Sporomusa sp. KB1]|nr:hypothetical protein Salpa_5765 [Sporomusa sp. KB1]